MSIAAEMVDKRVVRRNLERGVLERTSYQRYLDQLPDSADKCAAPSADRDDDMADEMSANAAP